MLLLNLLFASLLTFTLLRLAPGDPAEIMIQKIFIGTLEYDATDLEKEAARKAFDLNKPILRQYGDWLKEACRGNLGVSYTTRTKITEELGRRLPATLLLAGLSMLLALLITVILAATVRLFKSKRVHAVVESLMIFSITMPNFYLALVLVLVFSVHLNWLPVSGYGGFSHQVLPVAVLAFSLFGFSARLLNNAMEEVLAREYIVTARAKGLDAKRVFKKHVLRNAMVPVAPYLAVQFAHLLGGVVIIETVFSLPGVGKYLVDSINTRDIPAIQGAVVFVALMFSSVNILADLLIAWLDPRIRFSG